MNWIVASMTLNDRLDTLVRLLKARVSNMVMEMFQR